MKSKIDNDIARIKSISAGGNGNIVFDVSSNDTSSVSTSTTTNSDLVISSDMDFKNIDTTNLTDAQKEEIRQAFIGNVDTDYYYVDKTAGRKAQTQRLFYDGKEISDLSKITIKKGETIRITVKLPNTGGKIEYLTRTTADGERGDNPNAKIGDRKWEHYFEGHCEPYVNKNDIEEITIPSFINKINANAFKQCTSLKKVVIESGVTEIGSKAFENLASLEEVYIPSSVTTIAPDAFDGCSQVQIINVD